MRALVAGATGYIGGRLVPLLLQRGHEVRVLARDPSRIAGRRWADQVDVRHADLLDPESLAGVFDGIDAAYYLVHSMHAGADYAEHDRRTVENFCRAAPGLRHVIYLGGLLPRSKSASRHLSLRATSGRILAEHLPTTEFRAGPIIGSGSASFEMLRYLTERLPVMVAPWWLLNEVVPISVDDVLEYLVLALDREPSGIVDIGAERLSYRQMMLIYADERRLRRLIVPVPAILPAYIGARWIGLVTPIPNTLAVPLVDSMRQTLGADGRRAAERFPEVEPIPYREAVSRALKRIKKQTVETRWSDALGKNRSYEYHDHEGLTREVRTRHVAVDPERVFAVVSGLGGDRGWLTWRWAWRARGMLDRMVGGPGLRRGRRHPQYLLPGDAVDFWRVEAVHPPHLLRLRAEMKLPGRAWLQWETTAEKGGTRLTQTAAFAPRGLAGTLYWYGLYPFHRLIFTGLMKAIATNAGRNGSVE